MRRLTVKSFARADTDAAARLLAVRHVRQRNAWPALDAAFEQPDAARHAVVALAEQRAASGAVTFAGTEPAAYIVGVRRPDSTWGPNVWIEAAGSAGDDAEAIRAAYALAAAGWIEAGRTSHFVVVPASDERVLEAWFSLGFGLQHVHGLRPPPPSEFEVTIPPGLTIRHPARADLRTLAELDLTLSRHQARSPVFSRLAVPTHEQALAELEADFDDPRFISFVAEHNGRVVGTATGCSLEMSSTNTAMMRPPSAGFLGFAAVLPEARGLGAGRALAEAVMVWSRDAGYEWMATDWRSTNLEANRSWRALGFRPTFVRLHRAIA